MSAHTPASKRTASAMVTPSAAAAPASAETPKNLSSKVLGMKFMQRANEGAVRARLEKERDTVQREQQWTAPNAAASPVASHAAGAFAGQSPLAATPVSSSPFAVLDPSKFSRASLIFAAEEDTSATPTLPYSMLTVAPPVSSLTAPTAPVAPFVPGRRSFGAFNTTVDSLVAEAKASTEQQAKGEKQDKREKKYSVSDNAMADHYVGLRGKGISRPAGGNGGSSKKSSQKRSFDESSQPPRKKPRQGQNKSNKKKH